MYSSFADCLGGAYKCCDTTFIEKSDNKPPKKTYSPGNLSAVDVGDFRRASRAAQLNLKDKRWDRLFDSGESDKPVHTTQTLTHPNPNKSKSNFDSFIFQTNHLDPEAGAQPPLDLSRLKQTRPSLQDSLRSLSPMMVLGGPGGSGIMMDDKVLDGAPRSIATTERSK